MSAYIVDRNDINFMMKAAEHYDVYWQDTRMKRQSDVDYRKTAQMLWDENIKSVQYRYPDCAESLENAPGPIGEDFKITLDDANTLYGSINAWSVIATCRTYEYQSCEHPGWATSEAARFVEILKSYALSKVMPDKNLRAPQPMNKSVRQLSKI